MFASGSEWRRMDFHLHTIADKEFKYSGEADRFISDYVDALKNANIGIGVITNHNKFDLSEFKALKKKAKRENIILYPGVELSVKEGASGIHCLIVFDENSWIDGKTEKINQFLNEVFKCIHNRENENTRCNEDLKGVIDTLETYKSDFFIIMAHVEQKKGFFEECNGGLITTLSKNDWFKRNILAFQKGRTLDKMNLVESWMGYTKPYIEGSDCKSIDDIGKGNKSFIKVGDDSFTSLVIALKDFENRISLEEKKYNHGYIKSLEFNGGKLDSKKIIFSPELNTLIGIRGSGKSSIIEVIRHLLGLTPSDSDKNYKEEVIKNILGSGGQAILEVKDNHNKIYKIKRILGEPAYIVDEFNRSIGAKVGSILNNPLYFGQKDLSSMKKGYERELLDKLVGEKSSEIKTNIKEINCDLIKKFREYLELNEKASSIFELKENLKNVQYNIGIFKENGIEEKLKKQVDFEADQKGLSCIIDDTTEYLHSLVSIVNNFNDKKVYAENKAPENNDLFRLVNDELEKLNLFNKNLLSEINKIDNVTKITNYHETLEKTIISLGEKFAEIKRTISIPNINPDDFSKLKRQESDLEKSIDMTTKLDTSLEKLSMEIESLIYYRNEQLQIEYKLYKEEIQKVNDNQQSLELSIEFKGDKENFSEKLKETFKGSRIVDTKYTEISEKFSDFISILKDILLDDSKIMREIINSNQLGIIQNKITENYESYLNICTPNKIEIKYHGKSLEKHSIGQRASALVLFILSQKENNLIMIDQPEDDLDNQVIYNEIIKEIKSQKEDVQFIFATHNANIPVLGDSEQVIAVEYGDNIALQNGSIDNKEIQNKIVDIMEGGQEAFSKRTEIYNLWA
jgi:predicted ATPase